MNKIPNNKLSVDERNNLRNRIIQSALKVRKKKLYRKVIFAAAACILFMFGIGVVYFNVNQPVQSIDGFVESASNADVQKAEGVTLILGNGTNLNLEEDNASIQYSSSGEEVRFSSGKTVNQSSSENNQLSYNTLLVPYGKRTDLQLSDGTVVWLNSGSKLIYPAAFIGNTREVFLEGEAIFEVTHNPDKPFKVKSRNQEITVLGTIFNVSHYAEDHEMYTVLKSGSVELSFSHKNLQKVRLEPGNLASFNTSSKAVQVRDVNVDDYFSWREGFLKLKNDSLSYIMAKISRYYNVEITIADEHLADQTFSGNLDLKEDVISVIKIIRETSDFNIESDGPNFILSN
jgi:hypothetical protein